MVAARLHWSCFIARRAFGGISGSFSLTRLPASPSSHSVTLPRVAHSGRDGGRRWGVGGVEKKEEEACDRGRACTHGDGQLAESERSITRLLGLCGRRLFLNYYRRQMLVRRCSLSRLDDCSAAASHRHSSAHTLVSCVRRLWVPPFLLQLFFPFLLLLHSVVFGSRGFLRLSSSLDSFLECFAHHGRCARRPWAKNGKQQKM